MTQTITVGMVVGLIYDMCDKDGKILETRSPSNPLFYVHGANMILPLLEDALTGQKEGFTVKLMLRPQDAFGDYRSDLVTIVDKIHFPPHLNLQCGMRFDTIGPDGKAITVEIKKIESNQVTIDGNHPLAGKELHFDLKVHLIRPATPEELQSQRPAQPPEKKTLH
jgi:FKBP-type peptidyl-prolyl cis-trans isomerase SlyD